MRRKAREAEKTHSHGLNHLLPILETSSSPLRAALDDALLGAMTWLTDANSTRWFKRPSPAVVEDTYQAQSSRIAHLEATLAEFRANGRTELCAPFRDAFDATGELIRTPDEDPDAPMHFSPASLFLCFAAITNLIWFADVQLQLVKHLHELEGKRRVNKVWFPSGIRKIGHLLRGGKGVGAAVSGEAENGNPDAIEQVGTDDESEKSEDAAEVADALGSAGILVSTSLF